MNQNNFSWSWNKTAGNRKYLVGILLLIGIVSFCNVMNSYSLKLLLDIASGEVDTSIIVGMCLPIVVAFIAAAAKGLQYIWGQKMVLYISEKLKKEMLVHSEKMKWSIFSGYRSGDILNRMIQDAPEVARIFPATIANLFVGFFSCLFALTYGFLLSWKMTIVALFVSPLVILFSKLFIPKVAHFAKEEREEDSNLVSYCQEQIQDVVTIKMFDHYDRSANRFQQIYKKFFAKNMKKVKIESVLWNGSAFVGFLGFAVSVAYGSYLCSVGEVTLGTVVGYAQLLNYIIWPFSEAPEAISQIKKSLVSVMRVRTILNEPIEEVQQTIGDVHSIGHVHSIEEVHSIGHVHSIEDVQSTGDVHSIEDLQINTEIEWNQEDELSLHLEDVNFGYTEDRPIIKGLTVSLFRGDMVGVIGESGCGKSTLIKLILDLYQPDAGSIKIRKGNQVFRGVELRHFISYVPQDHALLSGSIYENITLGNEKYNREQVIKAAKKAGIHDAISKMEKGYDTVLGENGENISFGQGQRIAIARALLKDAPILLLDEPTASLDKETEESIMELVKAESERGRICIVVSHSVTNNESYRKVIRFGVNT